MHCLCVAITVDSLRERFPSLRQHTTEKLQSDVVHKLADGWLPITTMEQLAHLPGEIGLVKGVPADLVAVLMPSTGAMSCRRADSRLLHICTWNSLVPCYYVVGDKRTQDVHHTREEKREDGMDSVSFLLCLRCFTSVLSQTSRSPVPSQQKRWSVHWATAASTHSSTHIPS